MKIEITAGGIYDIEGKEVPVGTELTVKEEPKAWTGRYRVVGGAPDQGDKVAITNPAATPKLPLEAKDAGSGWFAVTDADGKEWGKKLRKDDAEAFNSLSDDEKLALLKDED